jgi:hypothetical protein
MEQDSELFVIVAIHAISSIRVSVYQSQGQMSRYLKELYTM